MRTLLLIVAVVVSAMDVSTPASGSRAEAAEPRSLSLLFLGDNGHHQPAVRFKQLQPALLARGVKLVYSDVPDDLNPATLAKYDGLVVYANIDEIKPEQARALLDFVSAGKGFVPLHCASYCFRNNDDVVKLIGAQFQRHGTGTFRTIVSEPQHPVMNGFRGFESWDETYVHTKHHEKDRTVLEYRQEGDAREPWTWVRTHGKGRVFYTAWGHDARTWSHPGFHNLVERGLRWACGDDPSSVPPFADRPEMTPKRADVKPFEYVEANIPVYPGGKAWGTIENGPRKMQKPLPAEESLKRFVTPKGFEVRLFASEPDIGKPLAMGWDERGRLWLCESVDYPNELQSPGKGRDILRICEDTDHDGKADKFTVFAEKLSIPTAVAFCRGGVLVQNGTETIYLKDTDGDGQADLRKTVISGWGLGDTHGGVSNFQYGLDNWYYAMQGYNHSEPVIADGKKVTPFRQGFFRFKVEPDGEAVKVTALEFLRSTNNNTWGLGFSEEGHIFGSTANGNPSVYLPLPNRYYEAVRGWSSTALGGIAESNRFEPITEKVRQVDFHGGFTAAAGHALYTARAWPREYWNRTAFVCEPTGHLVATFVITPDGADFRSKNSWNILASDDEWSAPIMAEVGPDGQLWVLDWYNYIVQHNPTPAGFKTGKGNAYESELRDKKHGRVYRVVSTHPRPQEPEPFDPEIDPPIVKSLRNATPSLLTRSLRNDNMFWRRHAQRLLVERSKRDVVPDLVNVAELLEVDDLGLSPGPLHSLWTLHGLGALSFKDVKVWNDVGFALNHDSPAVRRAAVLVTPRDDHDGTERGVSGLWEDPSAHVRVAILLTASEIPEDKEDFSPSASAAGLACRILFLTDTRHDHVLLDAVTIAASRHAHHFLISNIGYADEPWLNDLAVRQRIATIAEHYARGAPVDSIGKLLLTSEFAKPPVTEAVLAGVVRGWPKDKVPSIDPEDQRHLSNFFERLSPPAKSSLATLAARWRMKALDRAVAETVKEWLLTAKNEKANDAARVAAGRQLVEFRPADGATAAALVGLISPRSSAELANGLLEAVARSESAEAGRTIVAALPSLTPAVRGTALRVLLSRVEWTKALLDGVEAGKAPLSDLSLDQKQSLASHPDKSIAGRIKPLLAKGGGLPNPDRQKVLEELLPLTKQTGDAVAGREVFKKQCAKCHIHGGEGTRIGPDLTGMAVHPKHELLTHLIDPSRSVEGNFRVYTVILNDGRTMAGLLANESRTAIEIVDTEAKRHAIQRDEIDELKASTKSLMPDGFEKQVKPEEIANLLEFLTQRGKFTPIPLGKAATIISTKGMFYSEEAAPERMIFADWTPKEFEGVPFHLVDPQGDRVPNVVMLHGPIGLFPPKMPKQVTLPCHGPAKAIHLLSGVSGWGFPLGTKDSVTMIVRLRYAGGETEDHPLKNGVHFADYIRRVDVPESKFAFSLRGQQLRYLAVFPKKADPIETIDLVKGADETAPIVMAVTVEAREN